MKRLLAVAVAALVSLPAAARATDVAFDYYCTTGSLRVCSSVRLHVDPSNKLVMSVWNLNGTAGLSHNITGIGLYHSPGVAFSVNTAATIVEYIDYKGNAVGISKKWKTTTGGGGLGNVEIAESTKQGSDGIIGCTDPNGAAGNSWNTCFGGTTGGSGSSFPGNPYVRFTFTMNGAFSLSNVYARVHSQSVEGQGSLKCDTKGDVAFTNDLNEKYTCMPNTTVPEPATMVLTATGLAALAAVRRRRRQKGEG